VEPAASTKIPISAATEAAAPRPQVLREAFRQFTSSGLPAYS